MDLTSDQITEIVKERVENILQEEKYEYPNAGKDAPSGVKEAIKEFRNTDPEERDTNILLYFLLGDGTPPYKMSQKDSEYTDDSSGEQKCANCEYLYQKVTSGEHICSQIRGEVEPGGWCNQWEEADVLKD